MKRNFIDTWSVIFDEKAKPLVGKIEFCEANTTDIVLKEIYDIDNNPLSNPIYCNGTPTYQVMLDEGDYTVRYYRYIGNGNMEHDNNENSWFLYKTELIKDQEKTSFTTADLYAVNTIDDLKNISDMTPYMHVNVLGYYAAGDCATRMYTWIPNASANDNGGNIIASLKDTSGYWSMTIPGSYIDVRWFGDFPDNTAKPSTQTSNLGQRARAATCANDYHKDLYFPAPKSKTMAYYIFDGSNTVSVSKDIICDNGVRFVVKKGTVGTKVQAHEIKKCDKYLFISESTNDAVGKYEVDTTWVNSSWYSEKDTDEVKSGARVGYVIDYIQPYLINGETKDAPKFKDTKIKFERDGLNMENVTFDNCEFVDCNKNITKTTIFMNMEIKQSWFDSVDTMLKCAFNRCIINIDNFSDADTYIKVHNIATFNNTEDIFNYGDLKEQTIHDATIKMSPTFTTILENFNGSINLSGNGSLELHNASVTFNNLQKQNLNLVDCWVNIPKTMAANNVAIRRGAIMGQQFEADGNVYLEDVENTAKMNFVNALSAELRNCKIAANVNGKNISITGCHLYNNASLTQYDTAGRITPTVMNCIFEIGSYYIPIAQTANTLVVGGRLCNNIARDTTKHWIKLNRTNFQGYDYMHEYVYEGNNDPYIHAANDIIHRTKKYDSKTGKATLGTSVPWFETPGKGYNAGGDPQWLALYNYDLINLRHFSFGISPTVNVTMLYKQSLIYVSDSYRHPYYTFYMDGLTALDTATTLDSSYNFKLSGGTSYDGYRYVSFGCDIYGHTGDDLYSKGFFYANFKFNIERSISTGSTMVKQWVK